MELNAPKYPQPVVLKVTGLNEKTLQRWMERKAIHLDSQNPGRGKKRLYSALDVIKLAVIRRVAVDLNMKLSFAVQMAEDVAVSPQEAIKWSTFFVLSAEPSAIEIISSSRLSKYGPISGDPRYMTVSNFYPLDGMRRDRPRLIDADRADERPINEDLRDHYASTGLHLEPRIIFPIGEIVKSCLLQLSKHDEVT